MKLAINGAEPVRKRAFPAQITTGIEEQKAVQRVMESGMLSGFQGNWSRYFWGGPEVQALEEEFADKFHVDHAIAVNSCTSALIISCGAVGIEPGDEVIVSPWSMTCSATAPLIYGGIPVFVDIEYDNFCISAHQVEQSITEKTKAIITVDLFGQPYDPAINDIAKKHNLLIIEDAAQAIGAINRFPGVRRYAGNIGDLGCFSFTQGKHLTSGEGGMIITNNDELAHKCRLIRNHGEAVINGMPSDMDLTGLDNIVGFNMRMTEIQAAITREQLKKLDEFIIMRVGNKGRIDSISDIPSIIKTDIRKECHHSYYVHPFYFKDKTHEWDDNNIHRDRFIEAVKAELTGEEGRADRPLLGCGYIKPLYMMPIFQNRTHWALRDLPEDFYMEGLRLNVEQLWKKDFFLSMYHNLPLSGKDVKDISDAFHKVWENQKELLNEEKIRI